MNINKSPLLQASDPKSSKPFVNIHSFIIKSLLLVNINIPVFLSGSKHSKCHTIYISFGFFLRATTTGRLPMHKVAHKGKNATDTPLYGTFV